MSLRKLSAWVWILIVVAIGVLAFLGNRVVFYAYLGLWVPFAVYHSLRVCGRCTNLACGLNPRSPDFFLRMGAGKSESTNDLGYSDINPLPTSTLPLAALLVLGLVGGWQFSPLAVLLLLAVAAVNMTVYQRVSCARCTNNCPNNKNAAYWEWKKARTSAS